MRLWPFFRPRLRRYVFEHRRRDDRVIYDADSEARAWFWLIGTDDPLARELSEWWLADVQSVPRVTPRL
jgi:hypothetical protein